VRSAHADRSTCRRAYHHDRPESAAGQLAACAAAVVCQVRSCLRPATRLIVFRIRAGPTRSPRIDAHGRLSRRVCAPCAPRRAHGMCVQRTRRRRRDRRPDGAASVHAGRRATRDRIAAGLLTRVTPPVGATASTSGEGPQLLLRAAPSRPPAARRLTPLDRGLYAGRSFSSGSACPIWRSGLRTGTRALQHPSG
jgi:hypothetical protein